VRAHSIITAKERNGMAQIDGDNRTMKERVGWIDNRVRDRVGLVQDRTKDNSIHL